MSLLSGSDVEASENASPLHVPVVEDNRTRALDRPPVRGDGPPQTESQEDQS